MKRMKSLQKILALSLIALFTLTGCQSGNPGAETATETSQDKDTYTVGILQFAQHGSLDNCRTGVIEGLAENGFVEGENLVIDYQNAQADMGITAQIADAFVSNKVDMIIAIATPAAMSSYNAAQGKDIPVVYTAVTDPVSAQLASADGESVGNVTGTSDVLPIEDQLKLMREILPEAKRLGILHTSSEANSDAMIARYQELAPQYGFELVTEAINTTSDIPLATDNILGKVDVMTNLLDNTVVNSLPTILDKANAKQIPVFGSEIEQVRIGCLGAEGVEYVALGKQTGAMAAKILKGEATADTLPFESITTPNLYLNKKVAEDLGITLSPDLLARATERFDTISQP